MSIRAVADIAFAASRFSLVKEAPAPARKGDRLRVDAAALRELSRRAFRDIAFYLRRSHLASLAAVLEDPQASENDRYVVETLLRNALIAAAGELPICQDTGTATVMAWKDESIATGIDDEAALEEGARLAYTGGSLRASQVVPTAFFADRDTGDNLPAQIHIEASVDHPNGPSYRFLFVAKGGGSANKTSFFQMSRALLEEKRFQAFLEEKVAALGTAACPPYRLAVVVGGTSAEENLRVLKLASTEILDGAPAFLPAGTPASRAGQRGRVMRDPFWEARLMDIARKSGLGAQFGGSALALDARVLRLSRHAASCPVSIGVSCVAHRNALAVIDADGVRLEELERDPLSFLRGRGGAAAKLAESFLERKKAVGFGRAPASAAAAGAGGGRAAAAARKIDLDRPMDKIRADLSSCAVGDRITLSGRLIVGRDAAHHKWHELILAGEPLPAYLTEHPIYYAGPADTPEGKTIGSFGPTTAQRMDAYADELMSAGASLVTLAKGNRSPAWTAACKKYGGFYLGTVGGAAALIAEENITESETIDYPELGMEAVRLIRVVDLIAFVIADDKGNELYARIASA